MQNHKMRIIYYTITPFFDTALPCIKALSKIVELHLLLEVSPIQWNRSLFDVAPRRLPSGIVPAEPVLRNCFPPGVSAYWKDIASFNLVVHNYRGIHPVTWWVSHKAVQFIHKLKPDLIHWDDVSWRLIWALPEMGKIPIVLNIHDSDPHSGEMDWRFDFSRKLTFGHIKHFILHNKLSQDQFIKKYNIQETDISVIPLGVLDVFKEYIKKKMPEEEKTILFFGRISPYKGLEIFIKSAKIVCDRISHVRFIIAGRLIPNYQIPSFCELPNHGCFELHIDYISNEQLAEFFQRASLIACPYTDATQSGVVLTAYAFRKPVVATLVGGLPEYVWDGETGFLVPPNNPEALANAIIRLLKNRTQRETMKRNIAKRNETDLLWNNIAQKTIKVYKNILSMKPLLSNRKFPK